MLAERALRVRAAHIRYGSCWEDADVLIDALAIAPGDTCLAIASGGDNALAMLAAGPQRVIAIDTNPAQLAALELRCAAFRTLEYEQLLELLGSRPSERRLRLYQCARPLLGEGARSFWDARPDLIAGGIAGAGKFERYLALFRELVLPLVHDRTTIDALLEPRSRPQRERFFDATWNSPRLQLAFAAFFSRAVMGRVGRDADCFRFAQGDPAARLQSRARHAMTVLDPAQNPYLTWIVRGRHGAALPFAYRPENYARIRTNLERLELRHTSLGTFLADYSGPPIARFNLSDVFEYMSPKEYRVALEAIVATAQPGARLAYWNMMVERRRPAELADCLMPLVERAAALYARDKAFFYDAFVLEEVPA